MRNLGGQKRWRGITGDERKAEGEVKGKGEERQPMGDLWRIVYHLM